MRIKLTNILIVFSILFVILSSALSSFYLIGFSPDFLDYASHYENTRQGLDFIDQRFEPVYYYLVAFFSSVVHLDFNFFVFIILIFSISAKLYAVYSWNYRKLLLFLFLYLNTSYIIYDIVSLRVNLSVSFFILSIYFSLRKKHTPFLIFLLLSIGSHYSSLLLYFVFLLSFNFRNKSKFTLMTLAVLLYFTSYLLLELALTLNINPLLSIYVTEAEKAPDIFSFNNLFISFLFIVLFSFFDKVNENLRVLWLTSFYLFLISNSLSSAPIIYFRYIDPSLLMLIIYIVSVKNCYGFRVRYYFGVIGISIFSIYKVISTLYLNPILNSSSYIV